MRYTTIIDLSHFGIAYRNLNVRLVYLHLCLIAGYHDDDRDIVDISIRQLASAVGISVSATRHALKILQGIALISIDHSTIRVMKWIPERSISPRPKAERAAALSVRSEDKRRQEEQERIERDRREQMQRIEQQTGKTQFMLYYESLERKAADGDQQALAAMKRHRAFYEQQKKQKELELKNQG